VNKNLKAFLHSRRLKKVQIKEFAEIYLSKRKVLVEIQVLVVLPGPLVARLSRHRGARHRHESAAGHGLHTDRDTGHGLHMNRDTGHGLHRIGGHAYVCREISWALNVYGRLGTAKFELLS
jgi:hypothetical protein